MRVVDVPDHAAALVEFNQRWKKEHKPAVALGIGLNTGAMAVGNMGTAAKFE